MFKTIQSTSSINNELPPSAPQLCMGIVCDYEKQGLSKVAAVKSILAAFSESAEYEHTPPDQIEAAVNISKHVLEFPDSEWSNVLARKAVNLDIVFSGMYSTVHDNRTIENIGDLKLHFGAAKPANTVETHRDWVIAWRIVFKATQFVSRIVKLSLKSTMIELLHTLPLSTQLPI
ncbi:hypothetical protein PILCRDRAFT_93647 [Piloderma croceum F 1598]|uniref:Uncharacterized protein n=1 Tax=Piloderma croceum (strain F 1598) TaxID=765440 RepID=A0A0C3EH12_PILCF|nr:hypothetical protein PILCRDRAFT_93647 [Piloderma croceum F 1598]